MVVLILLSSMASLCYAQSQSSTDHEIGIGEAEESLRTFLSSIDNERSYANVKIISSGDFATSAGDYYEFETDEGNFKVYKKMERLNRHGFTRMIQVPAEATYRRMKI